MKSLASSSVGFFVDIIWASRPSTAAVRGIGELLMFAVAIKVS